MYYCYECSYNCVDNDYVSPFRCPKCGSYEWSRVNIAFIVGLEYTWTDGDFDEME